MEKIELLIETCAANEDALLGIAFLVLFLLTFMSGVFGVVLTRSMLADMQTTAIRNGVAESDENGNFIRLLSREEIIAFEEARNEK